MIRATWGYVGLNLLNESVGLGSNSIDRQQDRLPKSRLGKRARLTEDTKGYVCQKNLRIHLQKADAQGAPSLLTALLKLGHGTPVHCLGPVPSGLCS